MAKVQEYYFCTECGYESSGYMGHCPICGSWNSFKEASKVTGKDRKASEESSAVKTGRLIAENTKTGPGAEPEDLDKVGNSFAVRCSSGIKELDRVLGGGLVSDSLILVGGDPGIGKSTLLLQVSALNHMKRPVLYVSGEESPVQIKMRAERLGISGKGIKLLAETNFGRISSCIVKMKPALCIVDSVQTIYDENTASSPGSVTQVREVTSGLLRLAKGLGICIILVGHVTKDGAIAGPKMLEHMVDTVLYFEGDEQHSLRILRTVKNRFGATNEIGIFEMTREGLSGVEDGSSLLLSERPVGVPGSAVTCCLEGTRPILAEIQALTAESSFASSQRILQGTERSRLLTVLAVIEKILGISLASQDVFMNVVGGIKIKDTGSDLAMSAAVISAFRQIPVKEGFAFIGEVGLTGELRTVSSVSERASEAQRLGFSHILVPGSAKSVLSKKLRNQKGIIYADTLAEAMDVCLKEV